jgi:hypothetical protein
MASPRLNKEQRLVLLTWLAADYDWRLICAWLAEKQWPITNRANASYYRKKYGPQIEVLRKERLDSALNTGLALKEERVARLKQHADELDKIKWEPDDKGRLWNEAAWRETLGEIAEEVGDRKHTVDLNIHDLTDAELLAAIERIRASHSTGSEVPLVPPCASATDPAAG